MASHAFLNFPRALANSSTYQNRLQMNQKRDIEPCVGIDWNLLERSGMNDLISGLLVSPLLDDEGEVIFRCSAWNRIFHLQVPVYRELILEFFSTVSFHSAAADPNEVCFRFRLGNVFRELSLMDLAWRSGIYTRTHVGTDGFARFLAATEKTPPQDYNEAEFWGSIAEGPYEPKSARESQIRAPMHRLLHRLIASTFVQKHGSEKVPTLDLFLLWCLVTPGRHLNFPFVLATYLSRKVTVRDKSPLCGGAFITKIADSFGLLSSANLRTLTHSDPVILGFSQLERMNILERAPDGATRIYTGVRVPRQRRRRREPDQAGPDQEVDLQFVVGRIQQLEAEQARQASMMQGLGVQFQWMAEMMTGLYQHHGIPIPHPFPSPYPPYPDYFQTFPPPPQAAAGPSTAHDHDSTESESD